MTLPSSGGITAALINVELGRASSASFSINGTAERKLAAKTSGAISFADFRGKSTEIVVNMAAGGAAITLQSLFAAADWTSDTPKRVVLPAGVARGNSASLAAAITIGATAWGGPLVFEVRGTVSGKGGAAGSGEGGNAFQANRVGNADQKLILNILSGGVLRGGGGGGGKGGTGGGGTFEEWKDSGSPKFEEPFYLLTWQISSKNVSVFWAADGLYGEVRGTATDISAFRYTKGSYRYRAEGYVNDSNGYKRYYIQRMTLQDTNSSGGAGGAGGGGQGYDGARDAGTAGVSGGTNAGKGGTGGTGGLYGATGSTGAAGANGNRTNGTSGTAGGAAGYGLLGSANVTLTNGGSILGRTG